MVMQNGVIVEKGDTDMIFESPKEEYTKRLIAAIPEVRL
jgi:ABC-type microcin C transport system duplicated ATPase subunit YejF